MDLALLTNLFVVARLKCANCLWLLLHFLMTNSLFNCTFGECVCIRKLCSLRNSEFLLAKLFEIRLKIILQFQVQQCLEYLYHDENKAAENTTTHLRNMVTS